MCCFFGLLNDVLESMVPFTYICFWVYPVFLSPKHRTYPAELKPSNLSSPTEKTHKNPFQTSIKPYETPILTNYSHKE